MKVELRGNVPSPPLSRSKRFVTTSFLKKGYIRQTMLEKNPTKYPYDRLGKESLKNRPLKIATIKLKERKRILTSS